MSPNISRHSRRHFFGDTALGTGAVALSWLLQRDAQAEQRTALPHVEPKAKRLIHIFSPGGVSQVDTLITSRNSNALMDNH